MSNSFRINDAAPLVIPYPNLARCCRLTQSHVAWLRMEGVPDEAMRGPPMLLVARGRKAFDGAFEPDADGEEWLVFPEAQDCVFWQPRSGETALWNGRSFAIGEDKVHAAATFSFGHCLNIFADPLDLLRASRDGIVIVDWRQTFDRLRDVPRIAVVESLLDKLEQHLQPPRLPEVFVLRQREVVE